jgi:phosphatidylglycerol:prolipoprotein diacylglycerol transferase
MKERINSWIKRNKRGIIIVSSIILIFLILLLIATKGFTIDGTTRESLEKNSNFLSLGSVSIKWYAVFIIYGIISATALAIYEGKKHNLNSNYIYDGLLIIVPVCLIGLRVWSLAFDNIPGNFFSDFFKFNEGGLAIHGAIIFGFIGILAYCYFRKISFLALMDIVVAGFLVGQIIGRWGNYMNGEVYGRVIEGISAPTKLFILNNYGSKTVYHPLFLYEGLWNFVGLIAIVIVRKKKNFLRIGDILGFYLVWYGVGRAWMEPLRSSEYQLGTGIQVSTLISILLIVAGVSLVVLKYILTRKKPLAYYSEYQFKSMPEKKGKNKGFTKQDKPKEVDPDEYMKSEEYLKFLEEEKRALNEKPQEEVETPTQDNNNTKEE